MFNRLMTTTLLLLGILSACLITGCRLFTIG
jgi:hypothetical protein